MTDQPVYEMFWRNKWLTAQAKTIDDMIVSLRGAADELSAMRDAGIRLDAESGGTSDDYARLVTTDPIAAKKFGLEVWESENEDELQDEDANFEEAS